MRAAAIDHSGSMLEKIAGATNFSEGKEALLSSIVAEISKLEIIALEIKVEGLLEKVQGGFRFTQFTIYPKVTVPEDKDEERAFRLLEKAEHACLITRSLSARVVVEATVVAGVAPVGV